MQGDPPGPKGPRWCGASLPLLWLQRAGSDPQTRRAGWHKGRCGFHIRTGGKKGASLPVMVGIVTGDRALMRPSAGPLPVTDDNCQAINPLNDRRACGWYGL